MRWIIIFCALTLAACNLSSERIAPDAGGADDGDASVVGDGGGQKCGAAYCCTSDADIPKMLGCGSCGHDTVNRVICENGVVVCDPAHLGGDRQEVVVVEEWASGIGDCVAGYLYPPDGGGYDGGNDPDLVAHVEGQDDCYRYDFLVDYPVAYYGKQVSFTLTLTNGCSEPINLSSPFRWLTIYIYTHGVACCPSREDLQSGQHIAILPMDGWDTGILEQTLLPNQSIWTTLPWHPEADGMVNSTDAPVGLYDAYAIPPRIVRDAGDWRGPLSKFLVVRVVKQ